MARCEDYPCCGHTDGLGCDYTPDYDYIYKHAGCDHEAGDCYLNDVEPTCDVCGWDEPTAEDKMGWCGSCGCCTDHCQNFVDCEVG